MEGKAIQPQQPAQVAGNGATEIQLQYPVEVDGVRYEGLRLRRVTVGDLELMEQEKGGATTRSVRMVSLLTGLAPEVIRALDGKDFQKLSDKVEGFFD